MVYRKGQLSPAAVGRGWPHQVALPASACENGGYNTIHDFCKDMSLCRRGHCVRHDGQWFNVYCFADAAFSAGNVVNVRSFIEPTFPARSIDFVRK